MRSLRHEFFSTLTVLSLPTAILLAFPLEALRFQPQRVASSSPASVAFVTLSPDEEARALVAAKTAWQNDSPAGQRMRIRLPLGELPEEREGPLLDVGAGVRSPAILRPVSYSPSPWTPSQGASAPLRFSPAAERRPVPAFSRDELLKIH